MVADGPILVLRKRLDFPLPAKLSLRAGCEI
jgi:hypothetical protein